FLPRIEHGGAFHPGEHGDHGDHGDHGGDGWWFVVQQGKLLVLRGETPRLPSGGSLPIGSAQLAASAIFGDYAGQPCRVLLLEPDTLPDAPAAGYEWRGLRSLFGVLSDAEVALGGRAMQLAEWARTHRHCGACGTAMQRKPGERAMICPACG